MQDFLELPPKQFFKPAPFQGGSDSSRYRGSQDNSFFNAFKNGIQNGNHKNSFNQNDEKSNKFIDLETYPYSSKLGEWNGDQYSDRSTTIENAYEFGLPPPEYRLRKIFPDQDEKIQEQRNFQHAAERYAAFGARPLKRPQPAPSYPGVLSPGKEMTSSNHKNRKKESRKLYLFLWILIFLFIALGGISIGLGIHYGFSKTPDLSNIVNVSITVVNVTYDASLTDTTSSAYTTWTDNICNACKNILATKDNNDSFVQSCTDVTFRPGSIKVSLNLHLSLDQDEDIVLKMLNESFPFNFMPGYECRFDQQYTNIRNFSSTTQQSNINFLNSLSTTKTTTQTISTTKDLNHITQNDQATSQTSKVLETTTTTSTSTTKTTSTIVLDTSPTSTIL